MKKRTKYRYWLNSLAFFGCGVSVGAFFTLFLMGTQSDVSPLFVKNINIQLPSSTHQQKIEPLNLPTNISKTEIASWGSEFQSKVLDFYARDGEEHDNKIRYQLPSLSFAWTGGKELVSDFARLHGARNFVAYFDQYWRFWSNPNWPAGQVDQVDVLCEWNSDKQTISDINFSDQFVFASARFEGKIANFGFAGQTMKDINESFQKRVLSIYKPRTLVYLTSQADAERVDYYEEFVNNLTALIKKQVGEKAEKDNFFILQLHWKTNDSAFNEKLSVLNFVALATVKQLTDQNRNFASKIKVVDHFEGDFVPSDWLSGNYLSEDKVSLSLQGEFAIGKQLAQVLKATGAEPLPVEVTEPSLEAIPINEETQFDVKNYYSFGHYHDTNVINDRIDFDDPNYNLETDFFNNAKANLVTTSNPFTVTWKTKTKELEIESTEVNPNGLQYQLSFASDFNARDIKKRPTSYLRWNGTITNKQIDISLYWKYIHKALDIKENEPLNYLLQITRTDGQGSYQVINGWINKEKDNTPTIFDFLKDKTQANWLFIGDSMTHGVGTDGYSSAPQLLEQSLKNDFGRYRDVVINSAINGSNTSLELYMQNHRFKQYNNIDVYVLNLGTNDINQLAQGVYTVEQYKHNLTQILDLLHTQSPQAHVVLANIAPSSLLRSSEKNWKTFNDFLEGIPKDSNYSSFVHLLDQKSLFLQLAKVSGIDINENKLFNTDFLKKSFYFADKFSHLSVNGNVEYMRNILTTVGFDWQNSAFASLGYLSFGYLKKPATVVELPEVTVDDQTGVLDIKQSVPPKLKVNKQGFEPVFITFTNTNNNEQVTVVLNNWSQWETHKTDFAPWLKCKHWNIDVKQIRRVKTTFRDQENANFFELIESKQ